PRWWPCACVKRQALGRNTGRDRGHSHQRDFWADDPRRGSVDRTADHLCADGGMRLSLQLVRHSLRCPSGISERMALMTQAEILARVSELSGNHPVLVSLSGGNPAIQPLEGLIALGRCQGHVFAMETQGSVAQPWFCSLDWLILSPKPPSSGMATDWNGL